MLPAIYTAASDVPVQKGIYPTTFFFDILVDSISRFLGPRNVHVPFVSLNGSWNRCEKIFYWPLSNRQWNEFNIENAAADYARNYKIWSVAQREFVSWSLTNIWAAELIGVNATAILDWPLREKTTAHTIGFSNYPPTEEYLRAPFLCLFSPVAIFFSKRTKIY